jgi:hypothetical protein
LYQILYQTKKGFKTQRSETLAITSGWQDSNLRPPAPKAGALTGLRYTPKSFQ